MLEPKKKEKSLLEELLFSPKTKILEVLSENSLTCQINILGETELKEKDPQKRIFFFH